MKGQTNGGEKLPKQQKVRLMKTPTLMQAIALPLFPIPREKGFEGVSPMQDPKISVLKNEVLISSIFMFGVPLTTLNFSKCKVCLTGL